MQLFWEYTFKTCTLILNVHHLIMGSHTLKVRNFEWYTPRRIFDSHNFSFCNSRILLSKVLFWEATRAIYNARIYHKCRKENILHLTGIKYVQFSIWYILWTSFVTRYIPVSDTTITTYALLCNFSSPIVIHPFAPSTWQPLSF